MKSKQRLTKKICDAATYQGGEGKNFFAIWDSELRGFGMRITPGGGKSFIITYRIKNKKKMMSLGKYGVLTIDGARKIAREKLV